MSRPLRIRAFTRKVPAGRGYVGWVDEKVQQLQARVGPVWTTVDEEIVPDYAVIAQGCFGDTGGWVSRFAGLGVFGRNGVIR